MRCESCGYENRADSAYCGQCRAALSRPCQVCGEPAPLGAAACPGCGSSLAGPVASGPVSSRPKPPVEAPRSPEPRWSQPVAERPSVEAAAPGRPGLVHGRGAQLVGTVRDLRHRERDDAGTAMTVLDFRIERHDASGNRLAPVPVQMRGMSFSGSVNNGDDVRVDKGKWRHGTLRVEALGNLTTGASVRSNVHSFGQTVFKVVFGTIFCTLFFGGLAFLIFMMVNFVILGNEQFPWQQ